MPRFLAVALVLDGLVLSRPAAARLEPFPTALPVMDLKTDGAGDWPMEEQPAKTVAAILALLKG